MKQHNGMRPQDIVILLKIAISPPSWLAKNLSQSLHISPSEVSESLNRSAIAGLLSNDKRTVMKNSLLEFLEYGLKFVFPQKPGALVRGVPTSHSAPPLNRLVQGGEVYVWPYAQGEFRGQAVEPLYKTVPLLCKEDHDLYEVLALTDALRLGKTRERKIAIDELRRRIH